MDDFRVDPLSPYHRYGESEPINDKNRRKARHHEPASSEEDEVILHSEDLEEETYTPPHEDPDRRP